MHDREAANPYSPTGFTNVARSRCRSAFRICEIVLPSAGAAVIGAVYFRPYFVFVGDPTGGAVSAGMAGLFTLLTALLLRPMVGMKRLSDSRSTSSSFVDDGYERALAGIEAEVRPVVESRYASELKVAGLVKRWFLKRRMEREITEAVAARAETISPDSLF
jgi:hypothetical protein